MRIYEVRISYGARVDMAELRKFLKAMMTVEVAILLKSLQGGIKGVARKKRFVKKETT